MLRALRRTREIAFDTEANSMFAYRERLCLVQISTRRRDYIVDPLNVDVRDLGGLLADPGVVKVLHGAEFDVLLLKREHAFEIASLFDTRVAAASLGCAAPGLQAVLQDWLGVSVDKRFQRSDWGRRPLSDGQIDYARCDTAYLLELADALRADLRERGRPHVEEVAAECRRLEALQPEVRPADPDELLRIKGAGTLDARGRRALQQLNALRHRLAEQRDAPVFKVFGNEQLLELARVRPRGMRELRACGAVSDRVLRRSGDDLLAALSEARRLGPLGEAAPLRNASDGPDLDRNQAARYEALRMWRKSAAEERDVDPSLVLSRQQMVALAQGAESPADVTELAAAGVLEPWRLAHYGEALVDALGQVDGSHRERRPASSRRVGVRGRTAHEPRG
jgi:ribonuclease D